MAEESDEVTWNITVVPECAYLADKIVTVSFSTCKPYNVLPSGYTQGIKTKCGWFFIEGQAFHISSTMSTVPSR